MTIMTWPAPKLVLRGCVAGDAHLNAPIMSTARIDRASEKSERTSIGLRKILRIVPQDWPRPRHGRTSGLPDDPSRHTGSQLSVLRPAPMKARQLTVLMDCQCPRIPRTRTSTYNLNSKPLCHHSFSATCAPPNLPRLPSVVELEERTTLVLFRAFRPAPLKNPFAPLRNSTHSMSYPEAILGVTLTEEWTKTAERPPLKRVLYNAEKAF